MPSSPDPARAYLRTRVHTASPVELRVMLLDAAISAHERARDALRSKTFDVFVESLARGQRIILELESSIDHAAPGGVASALASLALYTFRRSVDACMRRDDDALAEVISLLSHERETWRMVREGHAPPTDPDGAAPGVNAVA